MAKPRMFQILDRMNVEDGENKTWNLGVCNELLYLQESKQGCRVTIGAPIGTTMKVDRGEMIPILLLVDKKTYDETQAKLESEVSDA